MAYQASRSQFRSAWICGGLAVTLAVLGWFIPARWRSTHPQVLDAAGRGTVQLIELVTFSARQQRIGQAGLVLEAALQAGVPGARELQTNLATAVITNPEVRALGGPDAPVAALLPGLAALGNTPGRTALELFLPADHRAAVRNQMTISRSPGVQTLLKILDLPTRRFVPVGQPGGQPLEAVALLTATLYERERLSPTLAQELRDLADLATTQEKSLALLEEVLFGLLSLSRRLDWTSLAELSRRIPDLAALNRFAEVARQRPDDFALLYTGAMVSGDVEGTARYLLDHGDSGRASLTAALRAGAGAVRWLAKDQKLVRPGIAVPEFAARAVAQAPREFAYARTGMFLVAALLLAVGLKSFWTIQSSAPGSPAGSNWLPVGAISSLTAGFLLIASEPVPPARAVAPKYQMRLETSALTSPASVANSSENKKHTMGPTTLLTIGIFAALQLAVYIICLRKLGELSRLPEPPLVRLRLLENEENLFDAGLYVGIGGTATALVLQVLQVVEANLLAAYSSNLLGIIGVALIKIGHVRSVKRQLILQSHDAPAAPVLAVIPGVPLTHPTPPAPASESTRANPFATR